MANKIGRGGRVMDGFIKKLKNILIKSGLKKEEELQNIPDIEIQKMILENFIQVKTCGFTLWEERYIYILKDQFEIIEKYNEVVE